MKREPKRLWLEALRSGEFRQTREVLRRIRADEDDDDLTHQPGLCCLGVLCEVAIRVGLPIRTREEVNGNGGVIVEYDQSDTTLPESVARWAGLVDNDGYITDDPPVFGLGERIQGPAHSAPVTLAWLNDEGHGFAEIADIIEQYIPEED